MKQAISVGSEIVHIRTLHTPTELRDEVRESYALPSSQKY